MDLAGLAELLGEAARKAEGAALPCAMEMAEAFTDQVTKVTLRRYPHGPFDRTPAPRSGPPGMVSGDLADSFVITAGASGGGVGSAYSGPTVPYARIQQMGGEIFARNRRALMWRTDYETPNTNIAKSEREGGGLFLNFARHVHLPARDYMRRGLEECIASGELERRKCDVFMAEVWG